MRLTVLGSGSCVFSQQERAPAGYILETAEETVLLETGTGTSRNLPKTAVEAEDIGVIINTHRHPDHVSDLIPYVQNKIVESIYYSKNEDKDLILAGPPGHEDYVNARAQELDDTIEGINNSFPFGVEITELEDSHNLKGLDIEVMEVDHGSEEFRAQAVRIDDGETVFVFTGDTDYMEELGEFSKDADILVTDCSMPDEKKVDGHMTPTESAKIADKANVETLVLSHLYPEAEEYDLKSQASETFEGEIIVAEDLMEIER